MRIGMLRRVQDRKARRGGRARPRLYFPSYFLLSFLYCIFSPLVRRLLGSRRLGGPGMTRSGWGWD